MPKDDEGSNQRFARRFTHGASPRKAPEKTPTAGKPPGDNPSAKSKSPDKED